jgi:hypothetical protein
MNNISEEVRFYDNMLGLTQLIQELTTACWEAGHEIIPPITLTIAEQYLKTYDKNKLVYNFIDFSHKYWNEIKDRDENFFIEHANEIFRDLPLDKVNLFATLFTSKDKEGKYVIEIADREAIWEYFESLVKIGIKYLHRVRGPKIKQMPNGIKSVYEHPILQHVELKKHAKRWNVKLEGFP